jgi:hypothetical protein
VGKHVLVQHLWEMDRKISSFPLDNTDTNPDSIPDNLQSPFDNTSSEE